MPSGPMPCANTESTGSGKVDRRNHCRSCTCAIEQFNRGEFWECHETLEDVWRETAYPFRLFYHAVIKTAVGFHHLTRHNRHGAQVKLRDGVELLELFQPVWMGVRTDLLLADAMEWLSYVEAPTVAWSELDGRAKPRIVTADAQSPCT